MPTPPLEQWSFLQICNARARTCRIEERQSQAMWEELSRFKVPPKLHHFVLKALWRKLPVAARMFSFKLISSQDCQLCCLSKDRHHSLKSCPYLSLPFSIIRQLWGAVIHESHWIEPSRLCLEHSLQSLPTVQGWLCWAAIYARWLMRCECITIQRPNITTAILQRWYSIFKVWQTLSQGSTASA